MRGPRQGAHHEDCSNRSRNVGGALADRLIKAGHEVGITSSDPASATLATKARELGATSGTIDEVVKGREAIFAGKIVIDPTNPLAPDYMSLTIGHTTSAGEQIAALLPGARVVKAFNAIFAANISQPTMNGKTQLLPVASDDDGARAVVIELGNALGFDAIDAGPQSNARYLEPMIEFLIQLAYGKGQGTGIGFSLAR